MTQEQPEPWRETIMRYNWRDNAEYAVVSEQAQHTWQARQPEIDQLKTTAEDCSDLLTGAMEERDELRVQVARLRAFIADGALVVFMDYEGLCSFCGADAWAVEGPPESHREDCWIARAKQLEALAETEAKP